MPAPSDSKLVVLFVCTGNTCRSPMAVVALQDALGADAMRVEVQSAGTSAWEGQPATQAAAQTVARAGLDLSGHRSRRVTPEMLNAAELILVMEPGHARAIAALGADPERTHVLSEWPNGGEPNLSIADPFGGSMESYQECWSRIRRHVERLAPRVLEALRTRST